MAKFSNNNFPVGQGGQGLDATAVGTARFFLTGELASDATGNTIGGQGVEVSSTGYFEVHTSTESSIDEVYLWATNNNASSTTLDIIVSPAEPGPSDAGQIKLTLQPQTGLTLVIPGLPLGEGRTMWAQSGEATGVTVFGYILRRFRKDSTNASSGFDGSE